MRKTRYFRYGAKETEYLKSRDKKLAAVIDAVGPVRRELDADLFAAVVRHIVGQQISNKALAGWARWTRRRYSLRERKSCTASA